MTRAQVEDGATTRRALRPTPRRPAASVVPVGSPPPDALSHLAADEGGDAGSAASAGEPTDADGTRTGE